jgi:antigen flippase
LAWAAASLGLAWICVKSFGLNGAGIAFFGSYVFYGFLLYPIVRRISGFRWSAENKRTGLVFLILITMVFGGFYLLSFIWATSLGALAALLGGVYSVRVLLTLVSWDRIPGPVRRLMVMLGFVPREV